ncbi:MAG: 50S ribosomal protein L19 [Saprospiraceae bacterium]
MDQILFVNEQLLKKHDYPAFRAGDNISVNYKIVEGNKERIQAFKGDVIQTKGEGLNKTFTVRKISNGVGVERIFPYSSPNIVSIDLLKRGKVRRAKLFYLRELVGKKARIKERKQ